MNVEPKAPRRRWRRRLLRVGGGFLLLLGAAYLLRGALFEGLLRARLEEALAETAGGTWSVGAIEGDWITSARVRDVRLTRPSPDGALREASCEQVDVRISLLDLGGPRAVRGLEATGLRLVIEGARGDGEPADPGALLEGIPLHLPEHRIEGQIDVRWTGGGLRAAAFRVAGDGAREEVALEAVRLEVGGHVVEEPRFAGKLTRPGVRSATWESADPVGGAIPRRVAVTAPEGGRWQAQGTLGLPGADVELTAGPGGAAAKTTALPVASLRDVLAAWGVDVTDVPAGGALAFDVTSSADALHFVSAAWRHPVFTATVSGAVFDGEDPWMARSCEGFAVKTEDGLAAAEVFGVSAALPVSGPVAVSVRGRRPAGGRVRLDEVVARAEDSHASATGAITLPASPADWRAAFLDLSVRADLAAADLCAALPEGARPSGVGGRLTAEAEVAGDVVDPVVRVSVRSDGLVLGDRDIHLLSASGALFEGHVAVEGISVLSDFGQGFAAGGIDLGARTFQATRLSAELVDLSRLSAVFPGLPGMSGSAGIEGRLDGSIDGDVVETLRGNVDVHGLGVVVDGVELGTVRATATAEDRVLTVSELALEGTHGSARLRGTVDRSGAVRVDEASVSVSDLATLRRIVPDLPEVSGAARVQASGSIPAEGGLRAAQGRATVEVATLTAAGVTATDVHAVVRAQDGRVSFPSLTASLPLGDVDVAGWFSVDDGGAVAGVLERLEAQLADGAARLDRPVPFTWSGGTLDVPDIAAQGTYGRVSGRARIGAEVDLHITAERVSLTHLHESLAGRATVELDLKGTPALPVGRLVASVPDLVWDDRSGALELVVAQDATGWNVERVFLDAGDLARVEGSGRLPLRAGVGGIERLPGAERSFHARAACERTGPWLERLLPGGLSVGSVAVVATAEGEAASVDLTVDDVRFVDELARLPSFPGRTEVTLRADAAGTVVHMARRAEGLVNARANLHTSALGDWTDPIAWLESARSAPLTGEVVFDTQQLAALSAGVEDIEYVSGRVRGALTVDGTVGAPGLHGRLTGEDLVLRLAGGVPALDRGRIQARLDGRTVWIDDLSGRIGYGDVQSTGSVTFGERPWPDVDLKVTGANVLLARTRDLRLRSDLDLALRGPLDRLSVTGRMTVTDALYSAPVDLPGVVPGGAGSSSALDVPSIRSGLLSEARFDVSVQATETVRVRNNLVRGALSVDLRLRGSGAAPRPEGRITFRDVRVTLPLSSLRVDQGSLTLPPGGEPDPIVQVSGGTRMQGYDLRIQATGRLSAPRIQVSSLPALSQVQALLLLTTGTAPVDAGDAGTRQAALDKTAGLVGQALLEWIVDPDPDDEALLDQVSLEIGRERAVGAWSTIELEVPFSPGWFVRGERDRYGHYNAGVVRRYFFR